MPCFQYSFVSILNFWLFIIKKYHFLLKNFFYCIRIWASICVSYLIAFCWFFGKCFIFRCMMVHPKWVYEYDCGVIWLKHRGVWFMVFNATFNNISAISHWHALSHNIVSSTPPMSSIRPHNISGDRHRLHR
jgi:hypothetical protein